MEAIEQRHKKFYLVSQAMLCFKTELTDAANQYWARIARNVLSLTEVDAEQIMLFSEVKTIDGFIRGLEEKRKNGQEHFFSETDIGLLNRNF